MTRLNRIVLFAAVFAAAGFMCAQAQDTTSPDTTSAELHSRPAEPDYASDPKFQKALAEAQERRQKPDDRLANWKHANKIAKNECVECLHQMIGLQFHEAQWKDAIASATQLDTISSDPREKAYAEGERGSALLHTNNGQPKPDDLRAAEASLSAALVVTPRHKPFLFDDGRALAMMGRDADAKAVFEKYADVAKGSDRYLTRVEHFIENPHLAALPMAPPFTVTTSDGEEFTLDDMNGKVVLVDFWATWCGPCMETLPEVARIAKDYKNDPMLVVISVSWDKDENAWKNFIQKNNMTWPQYRDAKKELSTAYDVHAIPHFFSIDTDGALKSTQIGADTNVRGMVSDLVKKAHKAEAAKAKAGDKAAGQ
jgi:thiol-disulfide isomerase/thioredoxin/Zn ribbon nucleic-acid-binding protein